MTIFRCVDLETTGIPSETVSHAIVEGGYCDVAGARGSEVVLDPWSSLCNPGRPIPAEASAVHHIRDVDVEGAPPPDKVCAAIATGGDYVVAHKADFEKLFFGGGDRPWIDTWKCALRVWPDAPAHKLQVLRYWLKFDDDALFDRTLAEPAHRAGPDAYCCAFLLLKLLEAATVDLLVRWSSGPALLVTCYMPKHRNKRWRDVAIEDPSYLDWIISDRCDITDRDLLATAKYWLKNRPTTTKGATTP